MAAWDFVVCRQLIRLSLPRIQFVYLGPCFCLRLPSDSASRQTPLPLANGRRSPAPVQDFHPRDDAHAGRTTKRSCPLWDGSFLVCSSAYAKTYTPIRRNCGEPALRLRHSSSLFKSAPSPFSLSLRTLARHEQSLFSPRLIQQKNAIPIQFSLAVFSYFFFDI